MENKTRMSPNVQLVFMKDLIQKIQVEAFASVKNGKYNFSAMGRLRKLTLEFEKLGRQFRVESIELQKEMKK